MSAIKAGIHRLQNFNFTTFISNSTSGSLVPFRKCCKEEELFSVSDRKCVHDFAGSRPDPSKFEIYYGFPCSHTDYKFSENNLSQIQNFFQDGSADIRLHNAEMTYHLKWGQYCLDVEKENKFNPILITCDLSLGAMEVSLVYLIPYLVSLLLMVITFYLHVAIPELRAKVKDKCFLSYLACLVLWILFYADVWGINGISLLFSLFGKTGTYRIEI